MESSDGLWIHHVDLAVADVERSLAFYLAVLGPLGLREWRRFPTYRGTEEVVYLSLGEREQYLGLRPADGGVHRYYEVGLEHLAFYVDTRVEVDATYRRCCEIGAHVHFPPEEDKDIERATTRCSCSTQTGHRIEIACSPSDRAG